METALGVEVLVGHSGGMSRGTTHLTERARDAIRRYRCVTDGLENLVASRFAEAFADFYSPDIQGKPRATLEEPATKVTDVR
jgi:molybdenum-dependent DNA-binding transcriptional regulator ModE